MIFNAFKKSEKIFMMIKFVYTSPEVLVSSVLLEADHVTCSHYNREKNLGISE